MPQPPKPQPQPQSQPPAPFHRGELAAQRRAGATEIAQRAAPFIRDVMPDQHRQFYEAQPFLVAASEDAEARVWATVLEGPDGFVRSPDARTLRLATAIAPSDPLKAALEGGADIGILGIEPASRRRNRLSGRTRPRGDTPGSPGSQGTQGTQGTLGTLGKDQPLIIDLRQSFGNCPQYITRRSWWRDDSTHPAPARHAHSLTPAQIARIRAADTLFLASGHRGGDGAASDGFDASHRGGAPGFLEVAGPNRLRLPDYAGNNFFNTIGNLMEDPRIGLLFVDFATGGLLHLSGRASVDWSPQEDQGAASDGNRDVLRWIDIEVEAVLDRPAALSLRWSEGPQDTLPLVVTRKEPEAEGITSLYLAHAEAGALPPFAAGQHLPLRLDLPGATAGLQRSYSLSNPPGSPQYRITVKRAPGGQASRLLHEETPVGTRIHAQPPAGDFTLPKGDDPLVLVSAGVGITPMVAMLHQALAEQRHRPLWFLHVARNGRYRALAKEVDQLIAQHPNAKRRVFFSAPRQEEVLGRAYDVAGRITAADVLAAETELEGRPQYLLCGGTGFAADLLHALEAAGIARSRIHLESFGA